MPNLRISQLPQAGPLQSSDLFAVVQNSGSDLVTYRTSLDALRLSISASASLLSYQGKWDAAANSPAIPAASASNRGHYYVVSTASNITTIDGNSNWQPTDWIISNGATWDKIDNTETYIIDTTYAGLNTLLTAGTLTKGLFYRITDFQTVHLIPNTNVTHTGAVEPLICLAVAGNRIHTQVVSENHSDDIIHYTTVNDAGVNGKGKILYRKDTVNNLETWYDFREVRYRRWQVDGTGMTAWTPNTPYTTGQLVANQYGNIYMAKDNFTSGSDFSDDLNPSIHYDANINNNYGWIAIYQGGVQSAWNTEFNEFQGGDCTSSIKANPDMFSDVNTFVGPCKNISIPKSVDAVTGEQVYNNIVFMGSCSNVTIGNNCTNISIGGGCNNTVIGDNNRGIFLFQGSDNNTIGPGCSGITISAGSSGNKVEEGSRVVLIKGGSNGNRVGMGSTVIQIEGSCNSNVLNGYNSNTVLISNSVNNTVGAYSKGNLFAAQSNNNSVGESSHDNRFYLSSYNRIELNSSRCKFKEATKNYVGVGCSYCFLDKDASGNRIGDNCFNIRLSVSGYGGGSFNNIIENGCTNCTVQGSNNTLMQKCSYIICNNSAIIHSCFFGQKVENKTFIAAQNVVNDLKILVPTNKPFTFDPDEFSYHFLVFSSLDSNGDVWAPKVDINGIITMVKLA